MTCGITGYFYDDVNIGGYSTSLTNFSLSPMDPPDKTGSLGLGAPVGPWSASDEPSCKESTNFLWDRSILLVLAKENIIATPAYSLWYNPEGM